MFIRFGFNIVVSCEEAVPMLLALSLAPDFAGRVIGSDNVRISPEVPINDYIDHFGNRISRIVAPPGQSVIWSDCIAEVDGAADPVVPDARQHPVEDLPAETLNFLTPSRYCESDELGETAWRRFGDIPAGWARVQSICDFVHERTRFGYQFGRPNKTAHDVYREKTGVCRDFAHLAIALCRAMNIPARYVSGYLGDIGVPPAGPGDFSAWFEAYLGGAWHVFDARHNTPRIGRIPMVHGCDASDVAMITSFGAYSLVGFRVWTDEIPAGEDNETLLELLATRPEADEPIPASSGRIGL